MPKKMIKTTIYVTCRSDDIINLQQGLTVQKMVFSDYMSDDTVEETWVELRPVLSEKELLSTSSPLAKKFMSRRKKQ